MENREEKPKVAVITYNQFISQYDPVILEYKKGIHNIMGIPVLILPETFTPKSETPSEDDLNFQELLLIEDSLETIFVFVGKLTSGGVAIIHLLWKKLKNKHKVVFISCGHDKTAKRRAIIANGIPKNQYFEFIDAQHHPCREGPVIYNDYLIPYLTLL